MVELVEVEELVDVLVLVEVVVEEVVDEVVVDHVNSELIQLAVEVILTIAIFSDYY